MNYLIRSIQYSTWIALLAVVLVPLVPAPADAQGSSLFNFLWSKTIVPDTGDAASLGDIDGDGIDDAAIGFAGRVFIHPGSSRGLRYTPKQVLTWNLASPKTFGWDVASAGDVNGDGQPDIVVGDPAGDKSGAPLGGAGSAYIFRGNGTAFSTQPSWSVSLPNSRFGHAVTGVGDVNGDGYDDVLIGDPSVPTLSSCITAARNDDGLPGGRVRLYLGSSNGLQANPAWEYSWMQNSAQDDSCLGFAVSELGDVNGDGYDDFIIGAPSWSDQTGRLYGKVFAFYGSSTGPPDQPSWSTKNPDTEKHYKNAFFGYTLDGGGDVDGDGFDDLLIAGSADYLNQEVDKWERRVFLYQGGPNGLQAQTDWFVGGDIALFGDADEVSLGGDVNNDGYADAFIPFEYSKPGIFLGSSSGMQRSPVWRIQHKPAKNGLISELEGDYNDDGRTDLMAYVNTTNSLTTGLHVYSTGPNPAPMAQEMNRDVVRGMTANLQLEGSDPLGASVEYAVETDPTHGSLSNLDEEAGTVDYQAPSDFTGADTFEFSATDPVGQSATASVNITVTNDAPVFDAPPEDASYETTVGEELTFQISVSDPNGHTLETSSESVPSGATIDWEAGSFEWTPQRSQTGSHELILRADDGTASATRRVSMQVRPEDADDDGVPNDEDDCPQTPAQTTDGCPVDGGDGIAEPAPGQDAGMSDDRSDSSTKTQGCGCTSRGDGRSLPLGATVVLIGIIAAVRNRRD